MLNGFRVGSACGQVRKGKGPARISELHVWVRDHASSGKGLNNSTESLTRPTCVAGLHG